jgi:hypothetical protein
MEALTVSVMITTTISSTVVVVAAVVVVVVVVVVVSSENTVDAVVVSEDVGVLKLEDTEESLGRVDSVVVIVSWTSSTGNS